MLIPFHITRLRHLQSGGIGGVFQGVGDGEGLGAVARLTESFGDPEINGVSVSVEGV
jgi:hypothetical protein